MTANKMKFFTLLFLLLLAIPTHGQSSPSIKYDSKSQKKIIQISNLLGKVEFMTCKKPASSTIGTIVKLDFEEDEVTISSFVLRYSKNKRRAVNINNSQLSLLGHNAATNLSELLEMNRRVTVEMYQCTGGGSGIFYYADKIAAS